MLDFLERKATGGLQLRYEDIAQDGRILLETLPVSLGVVWRALPFPEEIRQSFARSGVLPILTRLTVEAGDGPFAIENELDVEGAFAVAHSKNERGEVERLFLDIDTEIHGPIGRTNLPPPDAVGTRALAGRVRAEHVFTRPFAPPGERKVLTLELGGRAVVPPRERPWRSPMSTLGVAASARPLEGELALDPTHFVMGLGHTDSNQHVNSLVYPRLFEEAALRRLRSLGRSSSVLARTLDVAFRRPSFASDVLRVTLRIHEEAGSIVCTGAFVGEGESELSKARAYVKMTLA